MRTSGVLEEVTTNWTWPCRARAPTSRWCSPSTRCVGAPLVKAAVFDRQDRGGGAEIHLQGNNQFLDVTESDPEGWLGDTDPYYYSVACLGEWGILAPSSTLGRCRAAFPAHRAAGDSGRFTLPPGTPRRLNESAHQLTLALEMDTGPIQICQEPRPRGACHGERPDFNVGRSSTTSPASRLSPSEGRWTNLFAQAALLPGKHYHTAYGVMRGQLLQQPSGGGAGPSLVYVRARRRTPPPHPPEATASRPAASQAPGDRWR